VTVTWSILFAYAKAGLEAHLMSQEIELIDRGIIAPKQMVGRDLLLFCAVLPLANVAPLACYFPPPMLYPSAPVP